VRLVQLVLLEGGAHHGRHRRNAAVALDRECAAAVGHLPRRDLAIALRGVQVDDRLLDRAAVREPLDEDLLGLA
jgi:hypothetical protein